MVQIREMYLVIILGSMLVIVILVKTFVTASIHPLIMRKNVTMNINGNINRYKNHRFSHYDNCFNNHHSNDYCDDNITGNYYKHRSNESLRRDYGDQYYSDRDHYHGDRDHYHGDRDKSVPRFHQHIEASHEQRNNFIHYNHDGDKSNHTSSTRTNKKC